MRARVEERQRNTRRKKNIQRITNKREAVYCNVNIAAVQFTYQQNPLRNGGTNIA